MSLEDGKNDDYEALRSFMVLTFLPQRGNGKVASAKKVERGPIVFSSLIKNWQLVSDRLADVKLGAGRRPTIRYFPEQQVANETVYELTATSVFNQIERRSNKLGGRYWLTAETVLDNSSRLRLTWGQILQTSPGKEDGEEAIQCGLFVAIRKSGKQVAGKIIWLGKGVKDPTLYGAEKFIWELSKLMKQVRDQAVDEDPGLRNNLSWD